MCLSMECHAFAVEYSNEKTYRIELPKVEDSLYFDASEVDKGIVKAGWGSSLYLALKSNDVEKAVSDVLWVFDLPDGKRATPFQADEDYVFFSIPFEITGKMEVKAMINDTVVAKLVVNIIGTDIYGTPIRGWKDDSLKRYHYVLNSGKTATGWNNIKGKWYYFDQYGIMQTGWQYVDYKGKYDWYYLSTDDESLGSMRRGWQKIDDIWYYLRKDGTLASNEWYRGYWVSKDGSWKYQPKGSWKKDKNGWWFGDTSGWYAKNQSMKIDGVLYTFDAEGYLVE